MLLDIVGVTWPWRRRSRVRELEAELDRLRSSWSGDVKREIGFRDAQIADLRGQAERMQGGMAFWSRECGKAEAEAERLRGELAAAEADRDRWREVAAGAPAGRE